MPPPMSSNPVGTLRSTTQGKFYANYGLGSPFPEDAKLCAALNSFWPAAAPDAGRTFGRLTALPLLQQELGLHPQHPKVLAGQAASSTGSAASSDRSSQVTALKSTSPPLNDPTTLQLRFDGS